MLNEDIKLKISKFYGKLKILNNEIGLANLCVHALVIIHK